ncbi:hypothetical protein [Halobacterium jilantaiense]|uniref:Uncharacterized protein n=1 Tax=Halobacterium jilantaiense TaxID=355548 RepID=A0A1I0MJK3_9EURY|nr:hypothetical protein [Halobacterium jilantaiense]SEV88234.1 hypothetical protein SAMN04487945_0105 [Halobacterium jilantaiense]
MRDGGKSQEPLLIDFIAEKLRFKKISDFLPGNIKPAYILAFLGPFIDIGIIDPYRYIVADEPMFVQRPQLLITLGGLVFGVYGIYWMRDTYVDAAKSLSVAEGADENEFTGNFEEIVSFRTKLCALGVFIIISFSNIFFIQGLSQSIRLEGVLGTIVVNVISNPLATFPVIVEFGLMYFGITVLMPGKIENADVKLFFYDSRRMGGFGKIGNLFKRSYYLYSIGLLMYSLVIYGPPLAGEFAVSIYPNAPRYLTIAFMIMWVFGVLSISSSMYRTHRVILKKKNKELDRVNERLHTLLDQPYDIELDDPPHQEELNSIQNHLEKVRSTREYPSTFITWTQIGISVVLPQLLNISIQATLIST